MSAQDIYSKYLLGQDVWYFQEYREENNPSKKYDELKHLISKKLDVHFNNIAIVGSAKTGFSFNPSKKFKIFDEKSDFDIVIVSPKHLNMLWNAYLDMFYKEVSISEYSEVSKSIFKKFISLKDPTRKHQDIKEWIKKVEPIIKDLQLFFGIERPINYRVYESWEAVEKYHYSGIKQLKNFVNNNKEKEDKIANLITLLSNR
nr:hypothetical protein [uncultured Flavobacterium sp.]